MSFVTRKAQLDMEDTPMANTYNGLEYGEGEKVSIHPYMFGKAMMATIFGAEDTWTGAFYSDSSKQVRERSVVLENGRMARVPYHFIEKAVTA